MLATLVEYLKREDFKKELKDVVHPIFEMVAQGLRPYFFYAMFLILLNYFLLASIFFYLVRFKNNISLHHGPTTL
jgi:hypothetical protein